MKALDRGEANCREEAYRPAQCLERSITTSSGRQISTAMSSCSLEAASAANKQQYLDNANTCSMLVLLKRLDRPHDSTPQSKNW